MLTKKHTLMLIALATAVITLTILIVSMIPVEYRS